MLDLRLCGSSAVPSASAWRDRGEKEEFGADSIVPSLTDPASLQRTISTAMWLQTRLTVVPPPDAWAWASGEPALAQPRAPWSGGGVAE